MLLSGNISPGQQMNRSLYGRTPERLVDIDMQGSRHFRDQWDIVTSGFVGFCRGAESVQTFTENCGFRTQGVKSQRVEKKRTFA